MLLSGRCFQLKLRPQHLQVHTSRLTFVFLPAWCNTSLHASPLYFTECLSGKQLLRLPEPSGWWVESFGFQMGVFPSLNLDAMCMYAKLPHYSDTQTFSPDKSAAGITPNPLHIPHRADLPGMMSPQPMISQRIPPDGPNGYRDALRPICLRIPALDDTVPLQQPADANTCSGLSSRQVHYSISSCAPA
jgi:hypothetical protein